MFRLDEDRVVDATLSGGLARYINHSCNPNCVTEIVEVDRDVRIIIFAKRKIFRGEEVKNNLKLFYYILYIYSCIFFSCRMTTSLTLRTMRTKYPALVVPPIVANG